MPIESAVAIITGAASGIGRATALAFVEAGHRVAAVDRSAEGLRELERDVASSRLAAFECDVSDRDAPENIISFARQTFGRLDHLVNNAGLGAASRIESTSDADLDRYLGVNLRAVFRLTRAALAHLKRPLGCVVNVASTFGIVGSPGTAPYAASKAGVLGLTRQLAADYGPRGIRINAVAPGLIETPLTKQRLEDPVFRRRLVETIPFPRIGTPQDVAAAIRFLCSRDAAFINGHTLVVDGGWSVTGYVAPDDHRS